MRMITWGRVGWSEGQSAPVGEPLESGLTEATVISHPSSFWRVFEVSGVTAPTQRFRQACEWNCASWLARRAYIQPAGLGWVLLSQFSPFRYFPNFSALWVHTLVIEYHIHICQVSPQLNYGDTCQIWMLLKEFNRYICNIGNFVYREINKWSFSDPHSWYVAKYTGAIALIVSVARMEYFVWFYMYMCLLQNFTVIQNLCFIVLWIDIRHTEGKLDELSSSVVLRYLPLALDYVWWNNTSPLPCINMSGRKWVNIRIRGAIQC